VRHFHGGLAAWRESGLALEAGEANAVTPPRPAPAVGWTTPVETVRMVDRPAGIPAPLSVRRWARSRGDALAALVGQITVARLLALWLLVTLGFGLVYWLGAGAAGGLRGGAGTTGHDARGLADALYFSLVTALSIGYGDVVPVGFIRGLAVLEGAAGLLIFGTLISKLVSRRQEEVTDEIHRITFDDRLGRVRTNMHLVISEMQELAETCSAGGVPSERVMTRVESAIAIFAGETRTVRDLLYRPEALPDEEVLEAILASLWAGLGGLVELRACVMKVATPTPGFTRNTRTVGALAEEICGECVPRQYAPDLREWMDRIQALARSLESPAPGVA
jgi:potassium channel LctB